MNRMKNDWQDRDSVLAYFGTREGRARKAYRQQLLEQSSQGRQSELTGGGLIRSMGGWSAVRARRKQGSQEVGDERILGSSEFVQAMLAQAQGMVQYQIPPVTTAKKANRELEKMCKDEGITKELLQSGSRRHPLPKLRKKTRVSICNGIWLFIGRNSMPARRINISGSTHAGTE